MNRAARTLRVKPADFPLGSRVALGCRVEHPFHPFGITHLVTVVIIFGVVALGVVWSRRARSTSAAAKALGWFLIAWYLLDCVVRVFVLRAPLALMWPFHFCGWVHMIAAYALITGRPAAIQVQILLTFAGVLHSLVTPTPADGFPSIEYVRYFAYHGLLVGSAVWALFVLPQRFTWRSIVSATLVLQTFEVTTGVIDWLSGENFMYLRTPPPSPTLFDVLGPWPWYLLSLEVVSVISIAIFCALFALLNRRNLAPQA